MIRSARKPLPSLAAALFIVVAPLAAAPAQQRVQTSDHEVVVYGGTSAGVVCAVLLARLGRRVVLLEPTERIGGMTTCGLGATDIGNKAAIGGISREFYRRIATHYADDAAWVHEERDAFRGRGHHAGEDTAWTFEPKAALAVFRSMIAEAAVPVVRGARLDSVTGVDLEGGRIVAIRTLDGVEYRARCFVDATYEGDLLAAAGVSYRIGREANAEFGETLNGVQTRQALEHQFAHRVDPFITPGDPSSGLLPHVAAGGPGIEGAADHRVQAYCFRLCTTDVPRNRLPWPKPPDYDEREFELLLRNFAAGDRRIPWHPVWMPNRKTDTNNNYAFSTDAIGLDHGWPEADWDERDAIFAAHLRYTQGLLWTLANHPRVPAKVQAAFRDLGLAKDEFVETGHWPPQLYVREARRMVGDVVMTEHHCRGTTRVADPVGLGAYGMDSHNVQRHVDREGFARNEGDVQVHGFSPYGISYRAIVPSRSECTNLLVPVCVSATHIAFGSIRMEPVFMVLGHSAATAADLALDGTGVVQDVDYGDLAARLLAQRQVLEWHGRSRQLIGLDPHRLDGVVVDDAEAELTGHWVRSTSLTPFVGVGYVHDDDRRDGRSHIRFTFALPADGRHAVELAFQPHPNRASHLAVVVEHRGSDVRCAVDQRRSSAGGGDTPDARLWHRLTAFEGAAGEAVTVEVSNTRTDGYVVVDAARVRRID